MKLYYVTYGNGSNLGNCFSKVEVPDDAAAWSFVQNQIGPAYAFIYGEADWTMDGKTQAERYSLTEVPLQSQVMSNANADN